MLWLGRNQRKTPTMAKRNYKKEAAWEDAPKQVAMRVLRNKARRQLEKAGRVKKGDGKEVDHKKMLALGGTGAAQNLRVVSLKTNRKKQPKHKGRFL